MDCGTNIHDSVPDPISFEPASLLYNVEAFDASNGMFYDDSALANVLVEPFLHLRQGSVSRFFERHDDVDSFRLIALEATILAQPHARWVLAGFFIGNFLVVYRPEVSWTQEDNGLVIFAVDLVFVGIGFFFRCTWPPVQHRPRASVWFVQRHPG